MEHQDSQHRWIRSYNSLAENHLKLLKQQSICEFFSWKVSGVFFLTVFAAFYLQNRGIFPDAFFFIVPSGVICLMALALSSKKDLEYGAKIAECVDKGISIERKADLPCNIFQSCSNV